MKKILIILIVIFSTLNNYAQIVNIPDINFKNALIEDGIDTNNDGEIQVSEAEVVTALSVGFKNISSLEGIQSFINIETLHCSGNQLSSLDFSQNLNLEWIICGNNSLSNLDVTQNLNLRNLWCGNNQLSVLDVSQNLNLESLWCDYNQLSVLDLSQNLNLRSLTCGNNQLSNLDVTQNFNLEGLGCGNNQLSNLDVTQNLNLVELWCNDNQLTSLYISNGNNHNMLAMSSSNNINLTCIQIDDENATYPDCIEDDIPITGWCKDEWSSYSEDCSFGVNDVFATQITLYPNPVQNVLAIENSSSYNITTIKVYDIRGRLVLQESNSTRLLDFSHLAHGLLFVQIEIENGSNILKKVIKQ